MLKKLKERWGITSNFQIVIIFIVFGITGSVSAYFSGPLTEIIIGTNSKLHWSIKLVTGSTVIDFSMYFDEIFTDLKLFLIPLNVSVLISTYKIEMLIEISKK